MSIALLHPLVVALLPAALLPLFARGADKLGYSSFALLPRDSLSRAVDLGLRGAAALVVALLLLGAGGLHRQEVDVERIGEGAEIVLLLDRSRSMDEPFATYTGSGLVSAQRRASKGSVARELLYEFVGSRRNDLYGMLVFSTQAIPVLPLTDKPALVQAAIQAGNVGQGLAETDVGAGLIEAIRYFDGRPYVGSRLVMLISDGGARLDVATRYQVENLLLRHRVALYWIYLRSRRSPGIADDVPASEATAPARVLHQFFSAMETPYRAYDAEDPQALRRAIADVNRLQSLPIHYIETIPRRDLSDLCYRAALVLLLLLVVAHLAQVRTWGPE